MSNLLNFKDMTLGIIWDDIETENWDEAEPLDIYLNVKSIDLCFLDFHCWPLTTGLQVNQTDYIYLHFSGKTLFLFYKYLKCVRIIVSCLRKDYFWCYLKAKKCKDLMTSLIIIQPRTGTLTVTSCGKSWERPGTAHKHLHLVTALSSGQLWNQGHGRQSKKLKVCWNCKLIKPALGRCDCVLGTLMAHDGSSPVLVMVKFRFVSKTNFSRQGWVVTIPRHPDQSLANGWPWLYVT